MQTHPRGRHPAVFALAAAAVVGVLVLAGCSAAAPARPVASASARTRPPAAVTTSTSSAAGAPAPVSPAPATRGRGPAGPAGKWQTAQEVPGVGAMNTGGAASIVSVSCASAGNCSAVGKYGVNCGNDRCDQALVVSEVGGVWQQAEAVPGTATFNLGGDTEIDSVSCAAAGNCSAGGWYTDVLKHEHALVVSEVGGVWQQAGEVPGTAALSKGGNAEIESVSCASAGNCSAGGYYTDGAGDQQVFVVSEVGGRWQRAEEVPGTAALNLGADKVPSAQRTLGLPDASLDSVACASAGNCSAGGYYIDGAGEQQAFVVSEVSGVWQQAQEVPGTAAPDQGLITQVGLNGTEVNSVSCSSAGNCVAGGSYIAGTGNQDDFGALQVFVVSEVNGVWQRAEEVPGTAALNRGGAAIKSVSCVSAGNCSAGGYYTDLTKAQQAFVVNEVGGMWQRAEEVPGTAALNTFTYSASTVHTTFGAEVTSVSCASPGNCSAGGAYARNTINQQAFVVSEVGGVWQRAEEVPGTAALNKGDFAGINSVSCASAGNCSAGGDYLDASAHDEQAFVVVAG